MWAATVADVDRQADRVRVRLTGDIPLVAEITPAALDDLDPATRRPGLGVRESDRDHHLPRLTSQGHHLTSRLRVGCMEHAGQFFINGAWVDPSGTDTFLL